MNPTNLLLEIARIDSRRANLLDTIDTISEDIASLKSAWPDGEPKGGGKSDPTSTKAIKLDEKLESYRAELKSVTWELWEKRRTIIQYINKIDDPKYSRLLYLRYVRGLDWSAVGLEIGISERHAQRLEEPAIAEFVDVVNKEHEDELLG